MPQLSIGTWVKRLSSSTTARDIPIGILGRIGGLNPEEHSQPVNFDGYSYIPIQWQNGLWSSLTPESEGVMWSFLDQNQEQE